MEYTDYCRLKKGDLVKIKGKTAEGVDITNVVIFNQRRSDTPEHAAYDYAQVCAFRRATSIHFKDLIAIHTEDPIRMSEKVKTLIASTIISR